MYQKHQISLPGGTKRQHQKQETVMIVTSIQDSKPREKQISHSFSYCELINLLRNGTIVRCLWENKKTLEKSVFREAWSPESTSQSFSVPCFWSRDFVPHQKWNLMLLVHQNTGRKMAIEKKFLLHLSAHWGDLIEQINKKSVIYTSTLTEPSSTHVHKVNAGGWLCDGPAYHPGGRINTSSCITWQKLRTSTDLMSHSAWEQILYFSKQDHTVSQANQMIHVVCLLLWHEATRN